MTQAGQAPRYSHLPEASRYDPERVTAGDRFHSDANLSGILVECGHPMRVIEKLLTATIRHKEKTPGGIDGWH
jgi:hypothetical protein